MAAGIVAKESGTSSTLSTSQDYFPSSFVYPGSYICQKAEGLFATVQPSSGWEKRLSLSEKLKFTPASLKIVCSTSDFSFCDQYIFQTSSPFRASKFICTLIFTMNKHVKHLESACSSPLNSEWT